MVVTLTLIVSRHRLPFNGNPSNAYRVTRGLSVMNFSPEKESFSEEIKKGSNSKNKTNFLRNVRSWTHLGRKFRKKT